MQQGFKKYTILIVASFLLFLAYSPPMQSLVNLPSHQKVAVGDELNIGLEFPGLLLEKFSIHHEKNNNIFTFDVNEKNVTVPALLDPGEFDLKLKLFGLIPIKTINVDVFPDIQLIPGGHAVGVILRTEGVLVVGYSPIIDNKGNVYNPAQDAGIEIGDTIVKINNVKVLTDEQVAETINKIGSQGKNLIFTIKRNNKYYQKEMKPFFCSETNKYRIGLYVRDNAGGIGTLTFIDPATKKYGALGHIISDNKTNTEIDIKKGQLVRSSIEGINRGKRGYPGEKIGIFIDNKGLGTIDINSEAGIFGTLGVIDVFQNVHAKPMPVGFSNQVEKGQAEILTVIEGQKVEKFDIIIEKVFPGRSDGKSMIIKIVDPKLLETTGGIIQGMSGSPIIQNGRIIGAVTHVFINDPTRGYGIFIEDMLYEAQIIDKNLKNLGA
ncbi:MAG: SpoIVB peptidase [Clostridia bacterium]|nr:SpoIVB peptidase [Clostridia bacterium]